MIGWNPYTWEFWWVPHLLMIPLAGLAFVYVCWRDRRQP